MSREVFGEHEKGLHVISRDTFPRKNSSSSKNLASKHLKRADRSGSVQSQIAGSADKQTSVAFR